MNLSITLISIITLTLGLFGVLASIILHDLINKLFQFRIAPMVLGIFGIVIFFFGKYLWYILDLINNVSPPSFADYTMDATLWQTNIIANLMLARIPDLLLLFLSLSLIFDKTKNLTKVIAPYGLFFGVFYLICSSFSYSNTSYTTSIQWYEFLFVGDGIMRMPTITFILVSLMSLWMIITCKEYSRWSIMSSFFFGAIIIIYTAVTQIYYNVGANGFTILGYQGLYNPTNVTTFFPNYFVPLANLFGIDKNPDNLIIPIALIISLYFLTAILTFLFKNLFTNDIRRVNYIYKPWYYKSRVFSSWCSWVDASINDVIGPIFKNAYLYGLLNKDLKKIKLFISYLNNNQIDNIERDKLNTMAQKLEEKERAKNQKKHSKKAQQDIYDFDKEFNTQAEVNFQPQMNDLLNINIVQEWNDESGVTWGLDAQGKYFYKNDGKWLAYQY